MKQLFFPGRYILCSLVLFTFLSCTNLADKITAEDSTQQLLEARIARGEYLVNTVGDCMHCHATRDFTKYSGPIIPGTEGKGGEEIVPGLFVKNITPNALGSWTDEELYRVLTTGIRKNGDTLVAIMPYKNLAKIPREEVYSMIAYLRTLKPIAYTVPENHMDAQRQAYWDTLYRTMYLGHADEKIPMPPPDNLIKQGAYLMNISNCNGCHSRLNRKTMDYDSAGYMAGGYLFRKSEIHLNVNSANLTPDSGTGIGLWTEKMFVNKFANFRNEKAYNYNPGNYNSYMPWAVLANIKDADLKAIYAYLRTIKPINNKVEKYPK